MKKTVLIGIIASLVLVVGVGVLFVGKGDNETPDKEIAHTKIEKETPVPKEEKTKEHVEAKNDETAIAVETEKELRNTKTEDASVSITPIAPPERTKANTTTMKEKTTTSESTKKDTSTTTVKQQTSSPAPKVTAPTQPKAEPKPQPKVEPKQTQPVQKTVPKQTQPVQKPKQTEIPKTNTTPPSSGTIVEEEVELQLPVDYSVTTPVYVTEDDYQGILLNK